MARNPENGRNPVKKITAVEREMYFTYIGAALASQKHCFSTQRSYTDKCLTPSFLGTLLAT